MFISKQLMQKFHENRAARRALTALPRSQAGDTALEALKTQKKAIWDEVHRTYLISTATKLKIEMDGDMAGELRNKADGSPFRGIAEPSNVTVSDPQYIGATPTVMITEILNNKYVLIDSTDTAKVINNFADLKEALADLDIALFKLAD